MRTDSAGLKKGKAKEKEDDETIVVAISDFGFVRPLPLRVYGALRSLFTDLLPVH